MSNIYPPTPGNGDNSTDDLYASLLGNIGISGQVPSAVRSVDAEDAPDEGESADDAEDGLDIDVVNDDESGDENGPDFPFAPQVARSSFVPPQADDVRAYASGDNATGDLDADDLSEPHDTFVPPIAPAQQSGPTHVPTGSFTPPAAQNFEADRHGDVRRRPTFDDIIFGKSSR